MEINEALTMAINELGNEFTGYQLTNKLTELDTPNEFKILGVGWYLKGRNDIERLSRSTYKKKFNPDLFCEDQKHEISDAIKLLKNNGYKVLKPITEFKEL